MKKIVFSILLLLVFCASPAVAYDVYLKNGSVIRDVKTYEEVDGEVRLYFMGGVVSVPEEDIDRIEGEGGPLGEEIEAEMPGKPVPPASERPPRGPESPRPDVKPEVRPSAEEALKGKLEQIQKRLQEIKVKEDEADTLNEEYRRARLRIEVLWQRGRKKAIEAGEAEAQWLQYLTLQERQWAQLNTLKKKKLEGEMEILERELVPLRGEKGLLLMDKQAVEAELGKTLEEEFY